MKRLVHGDGGLDVVVDVAAVDQVEEAVPFEHVDHLWLHTGEVQVDAVVDAGPGDRHQDVGALGVDEVHALHVQDHTIDSCRLLDADLPETIRERIGVDEEETAVEAKDLEPGDRLDVLVTVEVVLPLLKIPWNTLDDTFDMPWASSSWSTSIR